MRREGLRRYPALGFLAVAAALALILPSRLATPRANPSSMAELAPVPGRSQDSGDLADLDGASSGGLGFGTGSGGRSSRPGGPGEQGRIRQPGSAVKRCVGKPPRQTEDPLSPPCVAFFEGDNGGATTRGVTRDEVTVVVHVRTESSSAGRSFTDWDAPPSSTDSSVERAGKAYARFFNERYQTYGRHVHLWGFRSAGGGSTPESMRADVEYVDSGRSPFAYAVLPDPVIPAQEAARRKIVAVMRPGTDRSAYRAAAPYLMSYAPDLEDQAASIASYVCAKLASRQATHAPDPSMRSRTRVFGLLYTDNQAEPSWAALKDLAVAELDRRCGVSIKVARGLRSDRGAQDATTGYSTAVAALRAGEVTTVINMLSNGMSLNVSNHAGAAQYYPEWVLSGAIGNENTNDTNSSGQLHNQAVWSGAFGLTVDPRRDVQAQQPWELALREACPDCPVVKNDDVPRMYDMLRLTFWGIQAAGPRLTPSSMDRGLHAIPQRGSPDPYRPAAYFAPGNWSFIKDAMEIWWDGASRPPGESKPGCYRLPGDGVRFRAGEWPGDEAGLFTAGPCQGSLTQGT